MEVISTHTPPCYSIIVNLIKSAIVCLYFNLVLFLILSNYSYFVMYYFIFVYDNNVICQLLDIAVVYKC